tara:strand:+ start:2547 stop:3137 length:591 start_codon:yes stop_codon:yes gene_type:complete
MILLDDDEDELNDIIYVSDNLRRELMNGYIEPYYKKLIVETLDARSLYKRMGMVFETTSKLCIAMSSILSFSTGYSENNTQYFAATAGSIGCLSLGLMQIASFAYKEQVRQSRELNGILKKLRLQTIPVERHSSVDTRAGSIAERAMQPTVCGVSNLASNKRRGSIYKLSNIAKIDEDKVTSTQTDNDSEITSIDI